MKTYRIAVIAGDGIGPEVISSGLAILAAAAGQVGGFGLEFRGSCRRATYLRCGEDLPADAGPCRSAMPSSWEPAACPTSAVRRHELTPQITSAALDLYAGIRPPARSGFPRRCPRPPIDLVIVRESTEGLFASLGAGIVLGDEVAADTQVITRRGTERVVRAAFELARRRSKPEPRVTCVDKANVLRSFAFFRRVFDEVAARFPDVAADHLYVDAAALEMVRRPERFDVIVTENLLGDILSDLAAGLVGGMGVAPSADVGDHHAVFQPCHGTAPDLAGQGTANPVATILSSAMMLEHLGRTRQDASATAAARPIDRAVERAVANGQARTADFGGRSSTREMTDAILAHLSHPGTCSDLPDSSRHPPPASKAYTRRGESAKLTLTSPPR